MGLVALVAFKHNGHVDARVCAYCRLDTIKNLFHFKTIVALAIKGHGVLGLLGTEVLKVYPTWDVL